METHGHRSGRRDARPRPAAARHQDEARDDRPDGGLQEHAEDVLDFGYLAEQERVEDFASVAEVRPGIAVIRVDRS
ncbi:hypothetical protein PV350_07575 [Streptomyces sp. PA03-6a]|nr:hypothetical protein [Streptomyces sp. PA03-6a]